MLLVSRPASSLHSVEERGVDLMDWDPAAAQTQMCGSDNGHAPASPKYPQICEYGFCHFVWPMVVDKATEYCFKHRFASSERRKRPYILRLAGTLD
jgi:hypothetical protein